MIDLLAVAPGIEVLTGEDYPTQISDGVGEDLVKVGRVRNDISHPQGVNLWVVADNLRKGASTNAVQIAEQLLEHYF